MIPNFIIIICSRPAINAVQMKHGDRLVMGVHHFFRFVDPKEASRLRQGPYHVKNLLAMKKRTNSRFISKDMHFIINK